MTGRKPNCEFAMRRSHRRSEEDTRSSDREAQVVHERNIIDFRRPSQETGLIGVLTFSATLDVLKLKKTNLLWRKRCRIGVKRGIR